MKIGFDAKRLYNNFTGLGNYSRFIVEALSEFYPDNEYVLFTPKIKSASDTQFFINASNIQTITPQQIVSTLKFGSVWRSFGIAARVGKENIEIYHGLSQELPYGISDAIKKVVTIHDLIFLRYPQFYNRMDVAIYTAKIKHACRVADRIIAISEQTKQDIVEFLRIDPEKITVIYQGCHPNFNKVFTEHELSDIRTKYNLPKEYILNVGTVEPRKNVMLIVKVLHYAKNKIDIPLVIVGRATPYLNKIKAFVEHHKMVDRVRYIENVAFEDLPAVYQLSKVFVYPSFFEGFGIPLIEAITCGVPVITSKGSCFLEAAGPSSIYIDPMREDELAAALERVIADAESRNRMISESKEYIKRFTKSEIAKNIYAVYRSVLARTS